MAESFENGRKGEEKAVDYLLSKGYTILERNWVMRGGEIDIIARAPDATIVFVEVKYTQRRGYNPLIRVTMKKQKLMLRAAEGWLLKKGMSNQASRIDVIAVTDDSLDHIRNALIQVD